VRRRGLLKWIGGALGGALGLALGVPAVLLEIGPARRRSVDEEAVGVGPLAELPEGTPVRRAVRAARRRDAWTAYTDVLLGAVWLVRRGGAVTAFSSVCPHAGCAVDWDGAAAGFRCPCHDSRFTVDGARAHGPAPRDLDRLEARVEAGEVQVVFRRYRPGRSEREPV
jgi:Rieske Fe-S protein